MAKKPSKSVVRTTKTIKRNEHNKCNTDKPLECIKPYVNTNDIIYDNCELALSEFGFDLSSKKTYVVDDFGGYKYLGSDPWSTDLINYIKQTPHYDLLVQLESPNFILEETSYYKMLIENINDGTVWGKLLRNIDGVKQQCNEFIELYRSIKNNGFVNTGNYISIYRPDINYTHFYGDLICGIHNDGSLEILDGLHRFAILIYLDRIDEIKFVVTFRQSEWEDFYNNVKKHYKNIGLYQPIDHPDFSNWVVYRDDRKEKFLLNFVKEHKLISAYDLGCCFGFTLSRIKKGLDSNSQYAWCRAVELDPIRYNIASVILKKQNISCQCTDMLKFMQSQEYCVDLILALSSLHHFMRYHPIEEFDELLGLISAKTHRFIYEVPEPFEIEYFEWMYPSIRNNIHEYIRSKTAYSIFETYDLGKRQLCILRRV